MASEVEICNLALARCGQGPIVNILDDNRNARLCNLHFDAKRDALLRRYRWKFAIKRASVNASATAPVYGYSLAYLQPTDCLRVVSVNDLDPEFDPDLDPSIWDIEGENIVTDLAAPLMIKYIKRVEDPNEFDAAFADALAAYLAYFMVASFRDTEEGIIGALKNDFNDIVDQAKYVNAIEGRPRKRRQTRSSWASGRNY